MYLAAKHGEQIKTGHWLALQQNGNILSIQLDADRLFHRHGIGLMRSLIDHRRESKRAPVLGFVDKHLLLILVDGGDTNAPRHEDISPLGRIADLEDALTGCELLFVDLRSENSEFVVVQQFE